MRRFVPLLLLALLVVVAIPASSPAGDDFEVVRIQLPPRDQNLAPYQDRMDALYKELIAIKQMPEFVQSGFGPAFPRGNAWMKQAMALRDEMEKKNLAYQVRDAGPVLVNLGRAYMDARRKGFRNLYELHQFEENVYDWRAKVSDAANYRPTK